MGQGMEVENWKITPKNSLFLGLLTDVMHHNAS